jgi:hypothetical protein
MPRCCLTVRRVRFLATSYVANQHQQQSFMKSRRTLQPKRLGDGVLGVSQKDFILENKPNLILQMALTSEMPFLCCRR